MQIHINGVHINYLIEGDGPWLVMSHSLACNLHMWDDDVKRLSREYKVLRFDTRGHGSSGSTTGPYSIESLTADLLGLLNELKVRETHFLGLSMGGMIGQALALSRPELVKSLILCDTSSELKMNLKERVDIVQSHGLEPMVAPTLQRFLSSSFRSRSPEIAEKVSEMIRSTSVSGYMGCCAAISTMNFTPRLDEIRCPTLILVGENDVVTPLSKAKDLQKGIFGSELFVVPHAAHLANLEQPYVFNKTVLNFLDRQPA